MMPQQQPPMYQQQQPAVGQQQSVQQNAPQSQRTSTSSQEEPKVTIAELNQMRGQFKERPNDFKLGLKFAKRLVEAARDLSSEDGRADQKQILRNRERYINDAHKVTKKLINAGSTDAMFYMADCYGSGGLGLPIDPKEAFHLYQSAAKMNHPQSAYRVAVCCELGTDQGGGTRRDPMKAIQWYKRAATLGDTPAMYKMGMILLKGLLGQQRDARQAVSWLKRAAERADKENPHALHELGLLYESARPEDHILRDERYAFDLFRQAAELGYKYSQYRLGSVFEYGSLGCPIDQRKSIQWYSAAAKQGEHQSELALSGWYLTGATEPNGDVLIQVNEQEAFLWARKAAGSGLAKAEFAMGRVHSSILFV
jgi:TPR repeat protein